MSRLSPSLSQLLCDEILVQLSIWATLDTPHVGQPTELPQFLRDMPVAPDSEVQLVAFNSEL